MAACASSTIPIRLETAAPPLSPRQQRLIQLLRQADRELSGQDLHALLTKAGPSYGLATVYRGLKQLQRHGLVRCRKLANGEGVYAPLERDDHHFTCVLCGCSERLSICPLGASGLGLTTVLLQGFRPLFHTFEIHGICTSCQHSEAASDG